MKGIRFSIISVLVLVCSFFWISSVNTNNPYQLKYEAEVKLFITKQEKLLAFISSLDTQHTHWKSSIYEMIHENRKQLKAIDFWLRYLEPLAYKKINGPLPVEWETEVFEKFEKPYKRVGAGLSLGEQYLEEDDFRMDSLTSLVSQSIEASRVYLHDSITRFLKTADHFFMANRMYLLNLATLYTSGFECPEKSNIIPELKLLLSEVQKIYEVFDQSFQDHRMDKEYVRLYGKMIENTKQQPENPDQFNHFMFIRDYVNPLFAMNQKQIRKFGVRSYNYNDFSLNDHANTIFTKQLFAGQDIKGVFRPVEQDTILDEIHELGKLFFYDPILSGNNLRSCASCHKPKEYFTDTAVATSLQFDRINRLARNTPSLLNVEYNHLIMLDGKHYNLGNQARDVLTNPIELNNREKDILYKVMGCDDYRKRLNRLAGFSTEKKPGIKHITSALIMYYSHFSQFDSPFDDGMNLKSELNDTTIQGFNIFMSKAQCGTCHFAPQFNGVKPPYIGSEFEVLGVPGSKEFKSISTDLGRFQVNPAIETRHAFRTGTIRNAMHTKPYMHNGVFNTLDEVIDFYDTGGGLGRGLKVDNQTLAEDSLKLSEYEKHALLYFIESLSEKIPFEEAPASLPESGKKKLNNRKIGGEY